MDQLVSHTHTHTHVSWGVQAKLQWSVSREGSSYHPCPTHLLCWRYTLYEVHSLSFLFPCLPLSFPHFSSCLLFSSSQLGGNEAPPSWQGQLGITYYITQQETNQSKSVSVYFVTVHEKLIYLWHENLKIWLSTWKCHFYENRTTLHHILLLTPYILPFSQLHLYWGQQLSEQNVHLWCHCYHIWWSGAR